MPPTPAPAANKCARADTDSRGSDNPSPSLASAKRPLKRVKDSAPSESDESHDESLHNQEDVDPDATGALTEEAEDHEDEGDGLARLERCTEKLGKKESGSGKLTAAEKRTRFAAKYAGVSDEETIGMSCRDVSFPQSHSYTCLSRAASKAVAV